jgi:hypothetical protein
MLVLSLAVILSAQAPIAPVTARSDAASDPVNSNEVVSLDRRPQNYGEQYQQIVKTIRPPQSQGIAGRQDG